MAIPIANFACWERPLEVEFGDEEELSGGVFVNIWDPRRGKGVGIGILNSHAKRRRFKSDSSRNSLLAKSKRGW